LQQIGTPVASTHDDKKQGVTVIVMQRINAIDLSAHVLETLEEEYVLQDRSGS
jgi:hypothetical protein